MADVTLERTGDFLRKLFAILLQHPEGMQAREAIAALREKVTLTEYEQGSYDSGGSRFDKIVRFATVDASKAGLILKQKGRWTVSEEGKKAYENPELADPGEFYRRAKKLFNEWKANQPGGEVHEAEEIDDDSSGKAASITFEQAEDQARVQIEQYLRAMLPYDFQKLVASLLRAMGYHIAWIAPPGPDGGIDIVAWTDPLGTRTPRIKVQVKRYGQNVSVEEMRSFMGLLGEHDVGIFVTTSGFTKEAEKVARNQERRQVTLVDLDRFVELWVEHYSRVDEAEKRLFPLEPVYFLAPTL